ncbi:ABC transporter substrate-binding protein [Paramicrobacterium chengjingii]|uniref:Thiamine pyrimidine synthase n=1 Tax=Paramicrobacterium chengjingii TaxID=2769067 RepID=A0ABX6YHC9_9MICO|nr:ABC transporter substrate-binding protein [Microbacterium chengjingii]QPZ38105.1 ABC transporter substrate-binding protein [Microbacterium chengjingii]
MSTTHQFSRRNLLAGAGLSVGAFALGTSLLTACSEPGRGPAGKGNGDGTPLALQLGWLINSGQFGEAIALSKGWYDEAGISFSINPGGPSIDGIALVAAGESQLGQISSSPSHMLARSQGIPVKAFAVCVQDHPYAWLSKPESPIEKPEDLIGKTVGGPATSDILVKALLAANKISEDDVEFVATGESVAPLMTGKIDAWGTWLNSISQRRPLGDDFVSMRLADNGVPLYGYIYYSTDDVLDKKSDIVKEFTSATARGWEFAYDNVADAAKATVEMAPESKLKDIQDDGEAMMEYVFTKSTAEKGWGTMDKSIWENQIALWDQLGQFNSAAPTVDELATWDILDATADSRPKLG